MRTLQHVATITGTILTIYLGITATIPDYVAAGYLLIFAVPYLVD